MPASVARAADIHWNIADGNWDTAANWVGGVVPGNADRGIIDFATVGSIAHVTTDIVDVKGISVAAGNTLSVEAGGIATTLSNTPDNVPSDGIHIADGGSGFANVSAGGTLATTGGGYQGTISVGRGGGTGTMTISGATSLVDANDIHIGGTNLPGSGPSAGTGTVNLQDGTLQARGGAWAFIGRDGGSGTMVQSGGNFSVGGQLRVGSEGAPSTGVYNISSGAATIGNDLMVGGFGSTGTVTQSGGSVNNSGGWAFVGRNNGTGVYNLSAGTFNVNGNMNIGFQSGTGSGTVNQSGGLATFKEIVHIGRDAGNGTYNLSGGQLITGERGVGNPDDDLVVGANFGTTGTLNQTGGTLTATRWIFAGRAGVSGGGTGVINQSAGTLTSQGWMRLGEAPGAVGTYNLSGTASATIGGGDTDLGDDDVVLGIDFGAQGLLNVSGTADLNASRDIVMGLNGGSGTMTQTGGTVDVTASVFLGQTGSIGGQVGNGTLTTTGGVLNVGVNMVAGLGIDNATNPTLVSGEINIGGTADVNVNGSTVIGEQVFAGGTATGVLNQTGGTLDTATLVVAQNAGATGDVNLSGGTLTALSTVNNGTIDASGTGAASLGPVSGSGSMTVAGTATVSAQHVRQASLAMTGGTVTIAPTGTGTAAGVSVLPSYSLTGTSKLDLGDNKLITNVPVGTESGGIYSGVQGDVQRASNGGTWDQPGLTTSLPDAVGGLTSIGVATFEQIQGLGPTDTAVFLGQTVTGATTLAMYTYAGDANLDGFISGDDYAAIDLNVAIPGADGWYNGDFNYDGIISGDDYAAIDLNIALQGAPFSTSGSASLSGVTAVPEPATLSVIGLSALGLLRRRRAAK